LLVYEEFVPNNTLEHQLHGGGDSLVTLTGELLIDPWLENKADWLELECMATCTTVQR
jgi:hypothetical protein